MDKFNEFLPLFINPWTIIIFGVLAIFRKKINSILDTSDFALKYKDFSISITNIKKDLETMIESNKIDKSKQDAIKKINVNREDIFILLKYFSENDVVMLTDTLINRKRVNSLIENSIVELLTSTIVSQQMKSIRLQLTEEGEILRKVVKDNIPTTL